VRASLADQAGTAADRHQPSLAIALGANLPSPAGPPLATLLALRPLLEALLLELGAPGNAPGHSQPQWSPLFRTTAVGGPAGQPDYLNAVVLLSPVPPATASAAARLLGGLQTLEQRFGRQRREHWGPRSLDLDLLWWGDLFCRGEALELPHPRLGERSFVLAPLAAIDPGLVPPGAAAPAAALLAQLQAAGAGPEPQRLAGRPGWPD